VAAFRGTASATLARRLRALVDADTAALAEPTRVELLSGASSGDLKVLRRTISALPIFYPSRDTWVLVERWVDRAVAAGERFGVVDLLIGASATERGSQIWSLDHDFVRLARLGLVRLYKP